MAAGRTRLGVVFARQHALIMAVGPAGLIASRTAPLVWEERGQAEARSQFIEAARQVALAAGGAAPAWLSLPSREAALHLMPWPARKLAWLTPPPAPPLERLTPLEPEEVRWSLRTLPGGGETAQVAVVRRRAAEDAMALAQAAGLKVKGLDVRAGYAARAGAALAGDGDLFVFLHEAGAEWSRMIRGKVGAVGAVSRRAGEDGPALAARACQQAIQLGGLAGRVELTLAGPEAADAAKSLAATTGGGVEMAARALTEEGSTPEGLEWEGLALYHFLASGGGRTLFDLRPQADAPGLATSKRLTSRLAWAAGVLLVLVALQGIVGAWWGEGRVKDDLAQARAQLSELRGQKAKLEGRVKELGVLAQAGAARRYAGEVIPQAAALLPRGAWLERAEVRGGKLVLYVGGAKAKEAAKALPASGPYSAAAPPAEVTAPGSGRPAVKLTLNL